MKIETVLWAAAAIYFVVIGAIYALVDGEPAGGALLAGAAALGGLVAGWMWDWRRRNPDAHPRAQDRDDADAADDVGTVGVYPTASLRPLALGVGITAAALGVVLGSWMSIAGVGIIASQIALLTRDADR